MPSSSRARRLWSRTRSFCRPTIRRSGSVTMPRWRRSPCGWPRVHEEAAGATVHDVSRPELARRAGLTDWPGFDLHSLRPASVHGPAEDRAIEVKGCAGSGGVEVSENEWAKAVQSPRRLLALRRVRLCYPEAPTCASVTRLASSWPRQGSVLIPRRKFCAPHIRSDRGCATRSFSDPLQPLASKSCSPRCGHIRTGAT